MSSATIEHVMPQTLSQVWKETLGNDFSATHARWVDTLGNLTLTGYNSELGNSAFLVKREQLKNTHFELSRDILSSDHWGGEAIELRGKRLADMAIKRWARPS